MKRTLNPHSKRYTTEELMFGPAWTMTPKEWKRIKPMERFKLELKHFNQLTREERKEYINLLADYEDRMAHEDALMASNY